jgi:hypothetical protein
LKVILSRKGFDSSVGGHASPILPDRTMLSLPIPSSLDRLSYHALKHHDDRTYAQIIDELAAGARIAGKGAHLDPDLIGDTRPRHIDWRPSFGQIGAAAGHLRNQGVGIGDLFLFYGWFRHTHWVNGRLRFVPASAGFHAIFGYLEVGEAIETIREDPLPDWLLDHPHAEPSRMAKTTNTIFVAAHTLTNAPQHSGAGVFRFNESLVLTSPGAPRSRWNLDSGIFRNVTITYHTDAAWHDGYFQSYPRAQEYVIHADRGVTDWAHRLITSSVSME